MISFTVQPAQQRNSITMNDEWLAKTTMKKTLGEAQ